MFHLHVCLCEGVRSPGTGATVSCELLQASRFLARKIARKNNCIGQSSFFPAPFAADRVPSVYTLNSFVALHNEIPFEV